MIDYEKTFKKFVEDCKKNDELYQKEIATKSDEELLDEFNKFAKDNNCKLYKPKRRAK